MAAAEVGDEQAFEDPTVNELCERCAELLGQEAAVFLPSGTMANQISYRVHCRQGDEVIVEASSHPIHFESGGPSAVAGIVLNPVQGRRGLLDAAEVRAAIRPRHRHSPRSRLVSLENTANMGGGAAWEVEAMRAVVAVAHGAGLAVHLDGARLANAAVARGVTMAAFGSMVDSVWLDFSKGLGAPIGACLAGSKPFIEEAWRVKQQLGGSMRQAGIVAAAALYGLEHHYDRLADDHRRASRLAEAIKAMPGLDLINQPVDTNLVFFSTAKTGIAAADLQERLMATGVRIGAIDQWTMRACTHLDVDDEGIERAVEALASVVPVAA